LRSRILIQIVWRKYSANYDWRLSYKENQQTLLRSHKWGHTPKALPRYAHSEAWGAGAPVTSNDPNPGRSKQPKAEYLLAGDFKPLNFKQKHNSES